MRSVLALAMTFAAFAGMAGAQERLLTPPYPATVPWKEITNKASPQGAIRERIPADQQPDAYKDILAAQTFPALKAVPPATYLAGLFQHMTAVCEGQRVNGPKLQQEGGRMVAYGQVYCGRWKGQDHGVDILVKVIQGQDALYVAARVPRAAERCRRRHGLSA